MKSGFKVVASFDMAYNVRDEQKNGSMFNIQHSNIEYQTKSNGPWSHSAYGIFYSLQIFVQFYLV